MKPIAITLGLFALGFLTPTLASAAESAPSTTTYPDVPADHWAQQALSQLLSQYGLRLGYPDGSFRGQQTLTRYEMAAVLLKVLERTPANATASPELQTLKDMLNVELEALQSENAAAQDEIFDRLDLIEVQQMEQEKAVLQNLQHQLPFKLSGSIALRHEHVTQELTGTPVSSTPQSRVILSLDSVDHTPDSLDPFAYGARLSVGNLRNSTNPWWRLGDFSARVEFALDRFFIRWQPSDIFDITAGKFANIYSNSELFMDTDVQPEGMFQRLHFKDLAPGWKQLSFILGETVVNMNPALGGNTFMLSAKGDTGFDLGFAQLDLSAGYHQYIGADILLNANTAAADKGLEARLVGNAQRNSADAQFGIANGAAALRWQIFDVPMALSGDYLYNVLAPSKNQAVQGKLTLGQAREVGQGQLSYLFKYLEQDASVSAFVEDQLQGTDVMAHEVQASVKVWDNTTLFGTYQWSQRLSEADATGLHTLRVGVFQAF